MALVMTIDKDDEDDDSGGDDVNERDEHDNPILLRDKGGPSRFQASQTESPSRWVTVIRTRFQGKRSVLIIGSVMRAGVLICYVVFTLQRLDKLEP